MVFTPKLHFQGDWAFEAVVQVINTRPLLYGHGAEPGESTRDLDFGEEF